MNRRNFLALLGLIGCKDNLEDMIINKKCWWLAGGAGVPGTYELLIVGYSLDNLNTYIDLSFDYGVYNSTGAAPVAASDLAIIFAANGGTATNAVIASVTKTTGAALTGGELTIRVNLTVTGTVDGLETIEITPSAAGSIKDSRGVFIDGADSTGEVNLNYVYDSDWQDVLDYAVANGIPIPDTDHNIIASEKVALLKSNGIWAELDAAFAFFMCHESIDFALINIKAPGVGLDAVESGLPTWIAHEGVKSGGGGYVNSRFIPSTHGVKYTQNNASILAYVTNNASANGYVMVGANGDGGATANNGNMQIGGRRNDDDVQLSINRNAGAFTMAGGVTSSIGMHQLSRLTSNSVKYYWAGSLIGTNSSVADSLTNREVAICGKNNNGTFGSADTIHNISFVAFGSNLDSKATDIETIISDWVDETALLPYTPLPLEPEVGGVNRLYMIAGQSNADGRGVVGDLPTILKGQLARCYVWRSGIWEILEAGVNANNGLAGSRHGVMISLAYEERIKHPDDILYFINEGYGATPLYNKWLYPTGVNYIQALDTFDAVIATGKTFTKEALIWWQGEGDTSTPNSTNYEANEQDFIDGIMGHTAFGKCVAINISGNTTDMPDVATVRAAKVANETALYYELIDSLTYNPTLVTHINSAGLVSLGEDISAIL